MLTSKKDAAKTLGNAQDARIKKLTNREKAARANGLVKSVYLRLDSCRLGLERSESDCAVSRNGASFLTS